MRGLIVPDRLAAACRGTPDRMAWQHLMNCKGRMLIAPTSTIRRFADLLEVDDGRVRLWMFARLATELDDMSPDHDVTLARALS